MSIQKWVVSLLTAGSRMEEKFDCEKGEFSPAIISGAFILFYLSSYVKATGEPTNHHVNVQQSNPSSFVPLILVIVIIALIIALIAACFKR